jgi:Uma2 family endonuclease
MSIAVEEEVGSQIAPGSIIIQGASWELYEMLLKETEQQHLRLVFDEGTLEIMSPRYDHEDVKKLLARMIEIMAEETDADIKSFGGATYRREDRRKGLEPDESYYFKSEPKIRGKRRLDLLRDPPPDLAVEVDITSYTVDKLRVYAGLGIPEIWNWENGKMQFLLLRRGKYEARARSASFPFVTVSDVQRVIDQLENGREKLIIREWRQWVRKQIE